MNTRNSRSKAQKWVEPSVDTEVEELRVQFVQGVLLEKDSTHELHANIIEE